jgi:hypothetical protein
MKQLNHYGAIVFDLFTITLLLILSFFLVFPFPAVCVGISAYFLEPKETRQLRTIFSAIRKNAKLLIKYSIMWLLSVLIASLNIAYFNSYDFPGKLVVLVVSWIVIVLCAITFVNAPIVILKMEITLSQLVYNCILLPLTNPLIFLVEVIAYAILAATIVYYPYLAFFILIPVLGFTIHLNQRNIERLSHKSIGGNNA